jgi:hypothetical protein
LKPILKFAGIAAYALFGILYIRFAYEPVSQILGLNPKRPWHILIHIGLIAGAVPALGFIYYLIASLVHHDRQG